MPLLQRSQKQLKKKMDDENPSGIAHHQKAGNIENLTDNRQNYGNHNNNSNNNNGNLNLNLVISVIGVAVLGLFISKLNIGGNH